MICASHKDQVSLLGQIWDIGKQQELQFTIRSKAAANPAKGLDYARHRKTHQ
jgi:hypothetical protein